MSSDGTQDGPHGLKGKDIECPECHGKGTITALVCPGGIIKQEPCTLCDGFGTISDEQIERGENGKKLRQDRLSRNMSLREEAAKIGITPYELSRIERGKS